MLQLSWEISVKPKKIAYVLTLIKVGKMGWR